MATYTPAKIKNIYGKEFIEINRLKAKYDPNNLITNEWYKYVFEN